MSYKNTHGAIIESVSNGSFSMLFNSDCRFFEGHFLTIQLCQVCYC